MREGDAGGAGGVAEAGEGAEVVEADVAEQLGAWWTTHHPSKLSPRSHSTLPATLPVVT